MTLILAALIAIGVAYLLVWPHVEREDQSFSLDSARRPAESADDEVERRERSLNDLEIDLLTGKISEGQYERSRRRILKEG